MLPLVPNLITLARLFSVPLMVWLVLNGHFENIGPAIEGIELALDALGRDGVGDLTILRIDHWELVRPETLAKVFPDGYPGIELEHASVIETSTMWFGSNTGPDRST